MRRRRKYQGAEGISDLQKNLLWWIGRGEQYITFPKDYAFFAQLIVELTGRLPNFLEDAPQVILNDELALNRRGILWRSGEFIQAAQIAPDRFIAPISSNLHRQSVNRSLDGLAERGVVIRKKTSGGRTQFVKLSATGRTAIKDLLAETLDNS